LRTIDADTRERAKSLAIEHDHERRLRLALRNRRQRELYGPKHQRRRREFVRRLERGETFVCPRCKGEITQDSEWELGHSDRDPSRSFPEHRRCNRSAANALKTSREW
jgi:hypothetical protein